MASNQSYAPVTYQPLKQGQIRLLLLSERDGEPVLQIFPVDLALAPAYFTLSYTWGDPPVRNHTILVDGALLKVTENLKALLPNLCRKYKHRYFWIDGICINQDDIPERNSQVQMFGEIYTQTVTCVIWLGENDEIIDHAILCLPSLVQKLQRYNPRLGIDEHQMRLHGIPAPTAPEWIGMQKIVMKDWFVRVWTFQEAVLPPKLEILCGNNLIPTDDLSRLAIFLSSMPESGGLKSMANPVDRKAFLIQNGVERINLIAYTRYQRSVESSNQYDFTALLGKSKDWKCSNEMDKIYGMRGLASKDFQENIKVDYDKAPGDLWLEFANYWLTKDPYFQIFHFIPSVQPKQPLTYKLPSWCPDLTNYPRSTPFWPSGHTAKFRAGIRAGQITSIEKISNRVIRVEGFLIDRVVKALPCPWERQNYANEESRAKGAAASLRWDGECLQLSKSLFGNALGPTYGPQHKTPFWRAARGAYRAVLNGLTHEGPDGVPDAYWRTIIANKHANGNYYSGLGREMYHLSRVAMAQRANNKTLLSPKEHLLADIPITPQKFMQVQDYVEALGYASHGRSFITTERGTIGLGPEKTKPGDLICIILNGGTPYILRETQPEKYVLVGESYVHGSMYGEALERTDRPPNRYFTLE